MPKGKKPVRELKGEFRVRPYTHGWELQGKYVYFAGANKGKEVWEADSWYGTFPNAIEAIVDKKLHTVDFENPKDVLSAVENARVEALNAAKEFNVTLEEARKVFKTEEPK